jgi:hypothetical protein
MKKLTLALVGLLMLAAAPMGAQESADFVCGTPSGHGHNDGGGIYVLDLQCRPALDHTVNLARDRSATVTVNLANYYAATGRDEAEFTIHLALERAHIFVREEGHMEGRDIIDAWGDALKDIDIEADEDTFTFIIENKGLRTAIFDVSVRPR